MLLHSQQYLPDASQLIFLASVDFNGVNLCHRIDALVNILSVFEYNKYFYCNDPCDAMETGFIDYLFVFFEDKGVSAIATTIKEGIKFRIA